HSLADPSGLFLSKTRKGVTGSTVTVTLDGRRPLTTEIQGLVAESAGGSPRRTTQGVDTSRVAMVQAVLLSQAGVNLGPSADLYVSCVGGAKANEPAADLAIGLSLTSSLINRALPDKLVVIGEVSLTGELRPVIGTSQRLAEAHRLGFTRAIIPARTDAAKTPIGMVVKGASTLREALDVAFPPDSRGQRRAIPTEPFIMPDGPPHHPN
ncbi:MAG TPA: magnesium chelatase domain-containing protein, partial [Beutenbergiaceae bacterium]|nr:magnesium chelatase domain-containing protein [Beutenbergiaceae bacterium]